MRVVSRKEGPEGLTFINFKTSQDHLWNQYLNLDEQDTRKEDPGYDGEFY